MSGKGNLSASDLKARDKDLFFIGGDVVSPIWAKALYGGVQHHEKIGESLKNVDNPGETILGGIGGLLGNYFLGENLPEELEMDLLKGRIHYSPSDRFNMNVQGGQNPNINLEWSF